MDVVLLGAGRSSYAFVYFFYKELVHKEHRLLVFDRVFPDWIDDYNNDSIIFFETDIISALNLEDCVFKASSVVISLLPPKLHVSVAKECLNQNKHLITASYLSSEMLELNEQVKKKKLVFINECGLDPGLDLISSVQILNKLKINGFDIKSYISNTGGLIQEEFLDNPLNYKITWNPYNVANAASEGARFKRNNKEITLSQTEVFNQVQGFSSFDLDKFEFYPNRNSLNYLDILKIKNTSTLIRGTIRYKGFSRLWGLIIKLGLNSFDSIPNDVYCYRDLVAFNINKQGHSGFQKEVMSFLNCNTKELSALDELGFFSEEKFNISTNGISQIDLLTSHLSSKLKLGIYDQDLVIMNHQVVGVKDDEEVHVNSTLKVVGDNNKLTAMAKTVGYTLGAILQLLINEEKFDFGVSIPIDPYLGRKILTKVKDYGIEFIETDTYKNK